MEVPPIREWYTGPGRKYSPRAFPETHTTSYTPMLKRKASTSLASKAKRAKTVKPRTVRKTSQSRNVTSIMTYPLPPKMRTKLKILHNFGLLSALTSSSSQVFRPTSYFDFDPAVGGPSFSGNTFFGNAYGRYRVTSFKYKATFINLEAYGVIVSCQGIANSSTPGSGTASDYTEAAAENDYGQIMVCAPATATPEKVMTGYVDCQKIWGTPEVLTDNDWAGATGASPPVNTWLRIAAHMANNTSLTIGVQVILEVESYGYWDMKSAEIVS